VLAAADYRGISGAELLTALAVAYQVQCRLCDVAPVRAKGFDHTTQGAYAVAAGVAKALALEEAQTAHALAICGTALNGLRVTRTGALSQWKGLAYPFMASAATQAVFLAMHGITGPLEVFEGNKGFMDAIAGPFELDWQSEGFDRVGRTILKKHNAEIHSQSAIEGLLALKRIVRFAPEQVERIDVEIFDVAYHIIGGGAEGEKTSVMTKEQADHSLPYVLAVAVLDDQVFPEQYRPGRILSPDVQALLRKIYVQPDQALSSRFPDRIPCRIRVQLAEGPNLSREQNDYEGFVTRPMGWESVIQKFQRLSMNHLREDRQNLIIETVRQLETRPVSELTALLGLAAESRRKVASPDA